MLYADQGNWEQVDSIGSSTEVATPDSVNDLSAGVTLDISSVALSYFLPGSAARPLSPSKAWLVLSGSALPYADQGGPNAGSNEDYQRALPPSDFTLALAGGKPIPAMLAGQGGPADESGDSGGWGLMGGEYYWEVPGDLRTATLKAHLPAELAARPGYYSGHWGSLTELPVKGIIPSAHVAFAPIAYHPASTVGTNPPAWAPRPAISPAPGTGHSTTASAKIVARAGSLSATLLVLIVVIAALVAVVAVIGFRVLGRRRLVPALARITASPAEKRTADVVAFLPSLAATRPQNGGAPPEPTGSAPNEPATVATLVKPAPSPARSMLAPVPDGPAPLPEGAIEVHMIGTVGLAGDVPEGAHELADSLVETLAALAQHSSGKPMSREELRAFLGTGRENEWSASTISTYLNGLRRVFGAERVPDATTGGGYRVVGIGTDIDRFYDFVALARAEPDRAACHLTSALSLVRGVPFSGVVNGSYGWADRHDLGDITTRLTNAVHKAAADLARASIDAGDHELATWAVDKGLLLWELEDDLNELALSTAAISPDRSALSRTWAAAQRRFAGHDEPVPDTLVEHYQALKHDR